MTMGSPWRHRILPLVVACPLFLQNLDTTVMATALPSMAKDLAIPVLDLKLAITTYLLSLAIFLPASAWLAERFGNRSAFCSAVILFSASSALCALAQNLGQLVACRILQGAGGALMVPLGRTILLQSFPADRLVKAMIWFTIPGALGRLSGPLVGGWVVTWASWPWIFWVNIPFGVLGAVLAWRVVDPDQTVANKDVAPPDWIGLMLLATALGGVLGGLELIGVGYLSASAVGAMIAVGFLALALYIWWSRGRQNPILDLGVLRFPNYRMAVLGGFPLRIAIGAAPFLLPLMLQLGFGMPAFDAGVLMMAMALGSLTSRASLNRAIRALRFRTVMVASAALASGFYAAYGFFSSDTPQSVMFVVLFLGGVCTSMTMITLNTLGYTEVGAHQTSHATAMSAMVQQLSVVTGVVLAASIVSASSVLHSRSPDHLLAVDFAPAFLAVALCALASAIAFRKLHPMAGEELRPGKQ